METNTFDFLNEKELAYILQNKNRFTNQLVNLVEEFCAGKDRLKRCIDKASPKWDSNRSWLDISEQKGTIHISKNKFGQRKELQYNIFGTLMITAILIIAVYSFIANTSSELETITAFFGILICAGILISLIQKIKGNFKRANADSRMVVSEDNELSIYQNQQVIHSYKILEIRLLYELDREAGDTPLTRIEIYTKEGLPIILCENKRHLTQLEDASRIAELTQVPLCVKRLKKNYSFKGKIRL